MTRAAKRKPVPSRATGKTFHVRLVLKRLVSI